MSTTRSTKPIKNKARIYRCTEQEELHFTFDEPIRDQHDILTSVLHLSNDQENAFYLQTPRLRYHIVNEKPDNEYSSKNPCGEQFIKIYFDSEVTSKERINEFYCCLQNIEDKFCKSLSVLSDQYFKEYVDKNTIKNYLFKSCIRMPINLLNDQLFLKLPLGKNCELYDAFRKQLKLSLLCKDKTQEIYNEAIFILQVSRIKISSLQAYASWSVAQMKLCDLSQNKILKNLNIENEDSFEDEEISKDDIKNKEKKKNENNLLTPKIYLLQK